MNTPASLTCEEVFKRLDDYLDRELAPEEVVLVNEHLESCVACASEYRFERTVLDAVRSRLRRLAVPAELVTRLVARLDAELPAGGSRDTPPERA